MARKRVIGIDPGITGGIVVLNEEGDIVQALRTPIYIEKSKKHYDVPGMREILMRAAKEGGKPFLHGGHAAGLAKPDARRTPQRASDQSKRSTRFKIIVSSHPDWGEGRLGHCRRCSYR